MDDGEWTVDGGGGTMDGRRWTVDDQQQPKVRGVKLSNWALTFFLFDRVIRSHPWINYPPVSPDTGAKQSHLVSCYTYSYEHLSGPQQQPQRRQHQKRPIGDGRKGLITPPNQHPQHIPAAENPPQQNRQHQPGQPSIKPITPLKFTSPKPNATSSSTSPRRRATQSANHSPRRYSSHITTQPTPPPTSVNTRP